MKSLKISVHHFPQRSRPLKPITVLFLPSVSLQVGNCFYNFITFKAVTYLESTDRILPLTYSARELMEKEAIELPWRFNGEWSCRAPIILKTLELSTRRFFLCGCRIVHFIYCYSEFPLQMTLCLNSRSFLFGSLCLPSITLTQQRSTQVVQPSSVK